jgi:hypothetical protein
MAKIKVDFTNVKESSGFNPKHMAEGDYKATITKADVGKSKEGNKQIILSIALQDIRSVVYPYYCGLSENQLWKLRNVLIAAGNKVPKKAMSIDTDKLVGKEIGISLEDDEYEGKMKSVIAAVFPADDVDEGLASASDDDDEDEEDDEVEEDDDEEEAPAPKKRKSKKQPEPEPEDDEDEDEDEDEEEPEEKPVSKRTAARRAAKAKAAKEAEEAEDDEDDEDEEPAPKKKRSKAKAKPVEEDEDDEDDDLDLDDI